MSPPPEFQTLACAECGADDLRSVPLVYDEGTFSSSTSGTITPSVGALLAGAPTFAADRTVYSTTVSQSRLAARLSPPPQPSAWAAAGLAFLCFMILPQVVFYVTAKAGLEALGTLNIFLFLVANVASVWLPIRSYRQRRAAWEKERATWERSWLCMRCGAVSVAPALEDAA